jgi:hypothetical protein
MADTAPAPNGVPSYLATRAATLAAMQAGEDTSDAGEVAVDGDGDGGDGEAVAQEAAPQATEPGEVEATEAEEKPAKVEAKPSDEGEDETEKRGLARVQAQAKREREAIAKERAEVEKARVELEKARAEADQFAQLKARAKYDPAAVLSALGLTDDDYEAAARDLYARSKAAAGDPKHKDAAIRMQREREQTDTVSTLAKQLDDLKRTLAERDQKAEIDNAWQGYYSGVAKTATSETTEAPLFRAALANDPAGTERTIRTVADQLYRDTGEYPDAQDVIVHYEKIIRAELKKFGLDPAAKADEKKTGLKKPQEADEKKTGKTLSTDLSTSTPAVPRNGKSREEHRAETLRLLEAGKLE